MELCIRNLRTFLLHDKLKLNDNKTEFILIGTRQQLAKVDGISLCVGDSEVSPVKLAKNLGAWIDSNLNLNPIQTGWGGLFEPPLRQNRDNFYTEGAMTFKFSDFS